MDDGTTHPIPDGLSEDPAHPGTYLFDEAAGFSEDPEHPQLYKIGS